MGSTAPNGFTTVLIVAEDPVPDFWVIQSPLTWQDPGFGYLEVPVGFRTDLASIPSALRSIPMMDPCGASRRPAAMHDWLYAERSRGKEFADLFLRSALVSEGASKAIADTYYYGVKWFGSRAWAADAGALERLDFDTPGHYALWRMRNPP